MFFFCILLYLDKQTALNPDKKYCLGYERIIRTVYKKYQCSMVCQTAIRLQFRQSEFFRVFVNHEHLMEKYIFAIGILRKRYERYP